jgi:O-antigen/teichoic acid export membrane protein
MQEDSLSYKTLRNVSYNFIGYVFPILFSIFLTPILVKKIGVVDFGVYVLSNTIGVFLSLADLGLSVALIKYLSEYNARGDFPAIGKLLSSANSLYLIVGMFGLLVYTAVGKWFLPFFQIGHTSVEHIFVVFLLSGLIFFLNAINSCYMVIPPALQRYDIVNKISLTQTLLINLSILGLLLLGYKLKAVMLATLFFTVLTTLAYYYFSKRLLPKVKIGFKWARAEIAKTYKFGLQAALSNLAVNSLVYIDRLIIPIFVGPAQLTYYSLPGNVAQKTQGLTNSLAGLLFPMASALEGAGESEKLKQVYVRAFRNLTVIAAATTSATFLFSNKILYFWVGADIADRGFRILQILAVTGFLVALYAPLYSFLMGVGKVKQLIYAGVGMAALNLVLVVCLVPRWGIEGAAWAYLISALPIIYIFYWVEKKYLKLPNRLSYYLAQYGKLCVAIVLYSALVTGLILPKVTTFTSIVITGPLCVLLFFLLYFLLGFWDKEDASLALAFVKKVFRFKSV